MFKIFKYIIIKFIYFLIERIERIEYKKLSLDENDVSKKILNSLNSLNLKVKTDTGYSPASEIHITQPYTVYKLILENGKIMECADNHIVFNTNLSELFVKNLKIGNSILTKDGPRKLIKLIKLKHKLSMFDLSIDDTNHRYYTNGILSHNTISAAIKMLHFITFNNDKNIMIVANKGETTIEIMSKIKNIYANLPFFLKIGIKNWAQRSVVFENGCQIKSTNRTKTPAIGFTIDFLYLDEFAHIDSTIINPYYRAVYPVVSAVENSKIVITSTPNGYNLFHKLLEDAERPDGDPMKSNYRAMRVYWYQVPGRFVTYYKLNEFKMKEYNVSKEQIFEQVKRDFSDVTNVELIHNLDFNKWIIHIYNNDICSEELSRSFEYTHTNGEKIKIAELSHVSTWKEDTIKDIQGEDNFNQEYGLRFINSSKSLVSEASIERMMNSKRNYTYRKIEELDYKLKFSYSDLKWVEDDSIFHPGNRKSTKIFMAIDISEGLGQDYSVINMFKLSPKSDELIESQKISYKDMSDFFMLDQIGIFRSNGCSVKQLAELFYMLAFEYFDPENVKVSLEYNTFGGEFLAHLPNIFDGNNNYGSFLFIRNKHRHDATEEKIGLKIGENKNLLVKEYKERIEKGYFRLSHEDTIKEITTFVKHETSHGNIVYRGDGSSDDISMTIVSMSTVFEKNFYKEIIIEEAPKLLTQEKFIKYNEFINKLPEFIQGNDYSAILKINKQRRFMKEFLKENKKYNNNI